MTEISKRELIQVFGIALTTVGAGCATVLHSESSPEDSGDSSRDPTSPENSEDSLKETTSPEDSKDRVLGLILTNNRDQALEVTITATDQQSGDVMLREEYEIPAGETVKDPRLLTKGTYTFRARSSSPPLLESYEWDSLKGCEENSLHFTFDKPDSEGESVETGPSQKCG